MVWWNLCTKRLLSPSRCVTPNNQSRDWGNLINLIFYAWQVSCVIPHHGVRIHSSSIVCRGRHYILPTKTTSIERDWDWILDTLWHVIPTKDAYDVLVYSPLGDSSFFCFDYIWEIAFSPTKDEYNEYICILANIAHEVLTHVSDISWGYVIHI